MKIAIFASRKITERDLEEYLPTGTTEIVLKKTNDEYKLVNEYATSHDIKITEFSPECDKYTSDRQFKQDTAMIEYADLALVFCNGDKFETKFVIDACRKLGVPIRVFA